MEINEQEKNSLRVNIETIFAFDTKALVFINFFIKRIKLKSCRMKTLN